MRAEEENVLWINTEPGSVCLHEFQQDKLGSFIYVCSANVLGTVALQWDLRRSSSVYHARRGKVRGTFGILFRNTSILFMKRIIDVRRNHLEFTMDSKSANDSVIRF